MESENVDRESDMKKMSASITDIVCHSNQF